MQTWHALVLINQMKCNEKKKQTQSFNKITIEMFALNFHRIVSILLD